MCRRRMRSLRYWRGHRKYHDVSRFYSLFVITGFDKPPSFPTSAYTFAAAGFAAFVGFRGGSGARSRHTSRGSIPLSATPSVTSSTLSSVYLSEGVEELQKRRRGEGKTHSFVSTGSYQSMVDLCATTTRYNARYNNNARYNTTALQQTHDTVNTMFSPSSPPYLPLFLSPAPRRCPGRGCGRRVGGRDGGVGAASRPLLPPATQGRRSMSMNGSSRTRPSVPSM